MKTGFTVQFCVPPDYEYLIAELYFNEEHWAELNTESGQMRLVLFNGRAESREFDFDDALLALRQASDELRRRSVFFENAE